MIESTFGISIAPATPWTSRAITSRLALEDAPHAAEASVNSASPAEKMRRRPRRSPSLAPQIRKTAEVSAYPAVTNSIEPADACRLDWIDGSATLTMKKSSTTMNVPMRTIGSGAHRLARARANRDDCEAVGAQVVV